MKDTKGVFKDIDRPLYREWRTTKNGMRYMVSSHRPLSECANVVMQSALDHTIKRVHTLTANRTGG